MKLFYGIKTGAVLQRAEDNCCKCFFCAETKGALKTSLGQILKNDDTHFTLIGIPVGGPYEIELYDDDSRMLFTNIYVGDVWLLAGQSNMEGAGKLRECHIAYDNAPSQTIRAYYMNESWDAAKSQLHQLWESADSCISTFYRDDRKNSLWQEEYPAFQNNGVGPGLYFAKEMQKQMGSVPQGVIPCGVGGASLYQWKPNSESNYYAAAKRRFYECGGHIKGIFWYQGEAQATADGCNTFISDMQELIGAFRKDFSNATLPFVQVQINKYIKGDGVYWMKLRELQRNLENYIPNVATVYSNDCELDDLIHLSSESHEKIGKRVAEEMYRLCSGVGVPSPVFEGFEIVQDDYAPFWVNIVVHFKNIIGKLQAEGVPSGFALVNSETGERAQEISRLYLYKDSVRIKVEIFPEKINDYEVCYAYGNDFYCNITDGAGRALPAFGPLKIKGFLISEEIHD